MNTVSRIIVKVEKEGSSIQSFTFMVKDFNKSVAKVKAMGFKVTDFEF
jgi:hypothetical protein